MNLFYKLLTGTIALVSINASAQNTFKPTDNNQSFELPSKNNQEFRNFHEFKHDQVKIQSLLKSLSINYNEENHSFSIQLPISGAQKIVFDLKNSQTLSSEFQSKYKGIYNLKGTSTDKQFSIRLTISDVAMYASITNISSNEKWIIQPSKFSNENTYMVFNTKDDMRINIGGCKTVSHNENNAPIPNQMETDRELGSGQITTLKIAVVSTTQFTNISGGGNQTQVAVANTIDRVSEIYERDLNTKIQLAYLDVLSDNTNMFYNNIVSEGHIFFLDKIIDYFWAKNLDNVVDLGHVFSNLGGGVAYKPSLCSIYKYGASSGTNNVGSEYFITTVAHEIGHQLNAGHTMSATTGSCGGDNYMKEDSWEIGGGSTIMSYSSACAPLHYVPEPYHYFHAGSIQNMQNQINSTNCINSNQQIVTPRLNSTTNFSSPVVNNSNVTYTIPPNTPFKLKIDATDPDRDALTYSFDQMDTLTLGMTIHPSGSEKSGPLFRHLPPSSSPVRYFPSLANLAAGNQNTYEVIPKVDRTINFLGLVRDNHNENGRTAVTNFTINVANAQDSFAFTNLDSNTNLVANGTNKMTIEWSPASSIVTGNVNIRFSTDNGLTYPHLLVANTANDGHEEIIVPNFDLCNYDGRLLIEAIDHIVFNVNKGGIKIESNNKKSHLYTLTPDTKVETELNNALLNIQTSLPNTNTATLPITKPLSNNVRTLFKSSTEGTNDCKLYGNSYNYDTLVIYPHTSGNYTFSLSNGLNNLAMEIHQGDLAYHIAYNNNMICSKVIYSSITNNSNNNITLQPIQNIVLPLCKDEKYTILIHNAFTSFTSALNTNYTFNISGGTVALNTPGSPSNYYNGFIIYDSLSKNIVAIKDDTDLRNSNIFGPSIYQIVGISANQTIASLDNTYTNRPFSILNTAIHNQVNGLDASLTSNERIVAIDAPLPIKLLSWNGLVNEDNHSVLSWSAKEDEQFDFYILESSEDGIEFNPLAHINKQQITNDKNTYHFIDENFKHYNANTIFYRLSIHNKDGKKDYTKVIALNKNATHSKSSIYPNPIVSGNNLKVNVAANNDYQIFITNTIGQMMLHQSIKADQNTLQISTKGLNEGIYFISIQNDTINEQHKFVVTQ